MDTNITKTWTIEINEKEVFRRCTNESLYQAYNRTDENPKGDAIVIQDDDYGRFCAYFGTAIANLHILLARRMMDYPYHCDCEGEKVVIFDLLMHDNHDDNMLPILITHCYDYLVRQVLELWFHMEMGSSLTRSEINHCLHFRKRPVRRRIGPIF